MLKTDIIEMSETIKERIVTLTKKLQKLNTDDLIEKRYQKFRNM